MKRLAALLAVAALPAYAQEAPRKWKDTAELTFLSSKGNSDVETFGASNLFTTSLKEWDFELKASALKSETAGTTTAERYAASEKLGRTLAGKLSAFERFAWDKDRFGGIRNRYDLSAGLGYAVMRSERDTLDVELGGGHVWEERLAAADTDYTAGRAFARYQRRLSSAASFQQDAEYLHDFEDEENYRVNAESSVTATLTARVSLKVSWKLRYVNAPPPPARKTDTLTTAAVVVNF